MITCYSLDQSPAELDGIVYNDARWWCFEILVTPRKGISGSLRAFLLLSLTLMELVHKYNIMCRDDNTMFKNSISAFALLRVSPEQRMSWNTSLIIYSETGLIFILRSTLMMEGGCGERERAMEREQGRGLECPHGPRHRWTRWEGNTSTAEALQRGVLKDQESVSPALHWWHWLYCHSVIHRSHQEPRGCDSPSTVASRLKALFPSKIKSLLG